MIAILLPSYERRDDLIRVLKKTPLRADARFIVVANYAAEIFDELSARYADRAVFINERNHGKLGVCRAYNLAYATALQQGFTHAILFADDVLPARENWLDELDQCFVGPGHAFGIFSSDECHHGHFGWNFIKHAPIAHFFAIRCDVWPGTLFDERYRQYVIDLDISVALLEKGQSIKLLPIRLRHYRSPLHRTQLAANQQHDQELFCRLHPDYEGCFERLEMFRYIPDKGQMHTVPMPGDLEGALNVIPAANRNLFKRGLGKFNRIAAKFYSR